METGNIPVIKTQYRTKEAVSFLREIYKALTQKNMGFQHLFDNYEEYWDSGIWIDMKRAKLIEDWIEPGSTMLDAGVGQGVISEYLMRKKNLDISGFDISRTACERARERGIKAEVRDINSGLNLRADEFYDYIQLSEVIEHTVYPQQILIDATLHTNKGVVVTIPNTGFISYRIQLLRGYAPRQSFTHLHYWSIKDFELFCQLLGIRILDFKTLLPKYLLRFRDLLAYQPAWLLAPAKL